MKLKPLIEVRHLPGPLLASDFGVLPGMSVCGDLRLPFRPPCPADWLMEEVSTDGTDDKTKYLLGGSQCRAPPGVAPLSAKALILQVKKISAQYTEDTCS